MRNRQYWAWILVCLPLAGCGSQTADSARLSDELGRVRSELAAHRSERRKAELVLGRRMARLEAGLAEVRRRPPPRVRTGDPIPGERGVARREPPRRGDGPPMRVSCPAALPPGARKVRRRMRIAKVRQLLTGVKIRRSRALTLSGSGSRTRRIWTGPCFRITIEADRVATVELDGVKSKKRRRRRRR